MTRTYTGLSSHNIIYFSMLYALNEQWQSEDSLYVVLGGVSSPVWKLGSLITYSMVDCGPSNVPTMRRYIIGKVFHSDTSVTLSVHYSFQGGGSIASLGIRDVSMTFRTSQPADVQDFKTTFVGAPNSTPCYEGQYQDFPSHCVNCPTSSYMCTADDSTGYYRPTWGYYFDGTGYSLCSSDCALCTGPAPNNCLRCNSKVLDYDGTCQTGCTYPYNAVGSGIVRGCQAPCQVGEFYYTWNSACLSSCDAPLQPNTEALISVCNYPCAAGEYLFWSGGCSSQCPYYSRTQNGYKFCDACQPDYFMYANTSCYSSCYNLFSVSVTGGSKFCNFPCPSGSYLYPNGACSTTCSTPIAPRSESTYLFCDYPCQASMYLYQDGSCLPSCQYTIRTENGYQFCDTCANDYYMYENKTCYSTCYTSFSVVTIAGSKFCNFPCLSGSYLYPNGACSTTCSTPITPRAESTYLFCDYPCQASMYLYPDGSCLPSCQYTIRTENGYQFCDTCANDYYMYENNTCYSTCYTLFSVATIAGSKFCNFPCLFGSYLYPNGACSTTCSTPITPRVESTYLFCDYPCQAGMYLYWDSSCLSSCQYTPRAENGYQFCDACANSYYMYENNTCYSACYTLFSVVTVGGSKFCNFPCPSGSYLYPNGACSTICSTPITPRAESTYLFCDYPCQANMYLYWDSSCLPSCQHTTRVENGYQFCDACANSYYMYENNTCYSGCYTLFNVVTVGGSKFCNFPCPSGSYLYPNGACSTTCSTPITPRAESTYLFCDYPCQDSMYLYWNGSCLSSCQHTTRIENGYQFCDACANNYYMYENNTCYSACYTLFNVATIGGSKFCQLPMLVWAIPLP